MGKDAAFDVEEEDEETLKLELQRIEHQLKLKRLQKAKEKAAGNTSTATAEEGKPSPRPSALPKNNKRSTFQKDENVRPEKAQPVQVPASPVRRPQTSQDQTSPRRVQLGIDKGLKARDISLKRAAPHVIKPNGAGGDKHEGYLRRGASSKSSETPMPARPLSFNERLASVRTDEAASAEKQKRILLSRSKAFGVGQEEMNEYKKSAIDIPEASLKPPVFSREEVLSTNWRESNGLKRSNTAPSVRSGAAKEAVTPATNSNAGGSTDDGNEASFEAFSSLHLTKRFIPHRSLARQLSGKKTMSIKDTLREIKAPDFALPDVEQDIVIFGVVAKKSEPRAHKPGPGTNGQKGEDRGKYMVMTTCDLDYELDLFLFDSGFERFWKLTEGTVVAILNPNVMPPPRGREDTGKFSLVINSDEDTIIEIGMSRDLGFCESIKKDGSRCGAWVNKKRTHYCEYHTNEALKHARSSRMEVNSHSSFGFGPKKDGGKKKPGKKKKDYPYYPKDGHLSGRGPSNYDWETKTSWFASRSMSAADLIDGKDISAEDRAERRAHIKRSLETKEKEREIMKKLGNIGDAAGREYMRRSGSRTEAVGSSQMTDREASLAERDASNHAALRSLGLQGKERAIELGSVKRKRPESSQTGSMTETSTGLGWGGGLRDKLARMKEGEKLRKDEGAKSPVRKKTRFVTEKGIRVAGRESLGEELVAKQVSFNDDDDDDELVIVK